MDPLRRRVPVILGILLGSPVCAEYLSAYLTSTGDAVKLIGGLIVFVPLYGCPALLIRELSVRRGLGWAGRLLLAACFGVLMTGIIDLSMFAPHSPEVPYWEAMRQPTLIPALGISAYTALSWALGHVLMSIGAPLALADALAPRLREHPLLGRIGTPLAIGLWLLAAALVHMDQRHVFGIELSPTQATIVAVVAAALAALALTPLGRPLAPESATRDHRPGARGLLRREPWLGALTAGLLGMLAFDFLPLTWMGVALLIGGLIMVAIVLARLSRTWGIPAGAVGCLAAGAVVARTITGLLAPLPPGVSAVAKYGQGGIFLAAALIVAVLVVLRTRTPPSFPNPGPGLSTPR